MEKSSKIWLGISGVLLIGAGYLIALFGINRFEKQVKEFGKAITADQQ